MGFVKIHLAMFSAEKGNQHDRVTQLEARAVLLREKKKDKKKSPCVSSSHFLIVRTKLGLLLRKHSILKNSTHYTCRWEKSRLLNLLKQ